MHLAIEFGKNSQIDLRNPLSNLEGNGKFLKNSILASTTFQKGEGNLNVDEAAYGHKPNYPLFDQRQRS
jgi:hypothetical protein